MAKVHSLPVKLRDTHGKRRIRRLRSTGYIPAILYGHGQPSKSLSLPTEEISAAVRHGNHFVVLTGDLNESAFIKEVQWNTWGTEILHIDFARVSEHEKVHVVVAVKLRGEAPGTKDGGVVKHVLHSIELECEASAVPEEIDVNINHLAFEQAIHVKDVEFAKGVKPLVALDTLIVSCAAPVEETEESAEHAEVEPEVIGRKKEEVEEDEKKK